MPSSDSKNSKPKKKSSRWLRKKFAKINSNLEPIWSVFSFTFRVYLEVVWSVLLFPFRLLMFPFNKKSLNLFHDKGVETPDRKRKRTFGENVGRFVRWQVLLPFKFLTKIRRWFKKKNRWDLIYLTPALITISFMTFVFGFVYLKADTIKNRYRLGANTAIQNRDFAVAKPYFQRLIADQKPAPTEMFHWARILAETGEEQRAAELIDELAPDFKTGFRQAHRMKALHLIRKLQASKATKVQDPLILQRIKWHLDHCSDQSAEISEAWGMYHLAMRQPDQAIHYFARTAKQHPKHYVFIAELQRGVGKTDAANSAMESARQGYRNMLDRSPFHHQVRVALADVLLRQGKVNESKQLLLEGVDLKPDPFIKRSSANFLVMQFDRARRANEDIGEQLLYLSDAIKIDPNYEEIYKRLAAIYMESKESKDRLAAMEGSLRQVVQKEKPNSLAHFVLGCVFWQQGNKEQAEFHIEQAYKLNKQTPRIANNLAWVLAHADPPDSDRALSLLKSAVRQEPENPVIRETYGSILIKLSNYEAAATELTAALSNATNKREVHRKLSIVYEKLGQDEQARLHRKQSSLASQN